MRNAMLAAAVVTLALPAWAQQARKGPQAPAADAGSVVAVPKVMTPDAGTVADAGAAPSVIAPDGGAVGQAPGAVPVTARAVMRDAQGKEVGLVMFEETPHGVLMTATFSSLPPGVHAFHVHEVGKCEPPFKSAGGHFNPTGHKHGYKNPHGTHAGDLPNLDVPPTGMVKVQAIGPTLSLTRGPGNVFDADGSTVIVHAGADDYRTDPAGNAGDRIACGVIQKP